MRSFAKGSKAAIEKLKRDRKSLSQAKPSPSSKQTIDSNASKKPRQPAGSSYFNKKKEFVDSSHGKAEEYKTVQTSSTKQKSLGHL